MMAACLAVALPDSNSPKLVLRHPTEKECIIIWNNTSTVWRDSLTLPLYLEESLLLTDVPLARNGGMTYWVLVHEDQQPNKRQILCSCETFRKHSLTSDSHGIIDDNIIHGVASVFCPIPYRRRGYAGRMMYELSKKLRSWQAGKLPCVGTTLYSDIGKEYYAKVGWRPNTTNSQLEIMPKAGLWPPSAKAVLQSDLQDLCKKDETIIRSKISVPTDEFSTRFTIVPDIDHMKWHISKEEFATRSLFGKAPEAKGAIAGQAGNQVWAIWTRRYYGRCDAERTDNVLYILRLVVEHDKTATRLLSDAAETTNDDMFDEQSRNLKSVLRAAQAEAAEWKLDLIKLWDPTPMVLRLVARSGLQHIVVERQEDSIASLLWYDQAGNISKDSPLWVNNEHYAWQ